MQHIDYFWWWVDIECLFVIWNNLASLTIDDPLWSGLSLLLVPKGSSQLESVEMTLSDLSIGPKRPKNIYTVWWRLTFKFITRYLRNHQGWLAGEFGLNLTWIWPCIIFQWTKNDQKIDVMTFRGGDDFGIWAGKNYEINWLNYRLDILMIYTRKWSTSSFIRAINWSKVDILDPRER